MNIDKAHTYLYRAMLAISVLVFLFNLFAFSTPFWLISWPRFNSQFKRLGLWTVCFNGLVLERDPTMQSYYGCWWILSTYFWRIRSWLFPAWFVFVEIFATVGFILDISVIFLLLSMYSSVKKANLDAMKNYLTNIHIFITLSVFSKFMTAFLFGLYAINDNSWMPNIEINYLHVSYASQVISTLLGALSLCLSIVIFYFIYKKPDMMRVIDQQVVTDI